MGVPCIGICGPPGGIIDPAGELGGGGPVGRGEGAPCCGGTGGAGPVGGAIWAVIGDCVGGCPPGGPGGRIGCCIIPPDELAASPPSPIKIVYKRNEYVIDKLHALIFMHTY